MLGSSDLPAMISAKVFLFRIGVLLLLIICSGCASSGVTSYKRAIIDVGDIDKAIATEKMIGSQIGRAVQPGTAWFEVRSGTMPVIITAPHATRPFREGEYRFPDGGGTAALALALHEVCKTTAVFTTYDSPSDPNFYDDNEFKYTLGRLIETTRPVLLIDIHASHPHRPYELDIGTMNGASLLHDNMLVAQLVKAVNDEGLSNVSHNWFAASRNQTITKYASARGVPAVQLEFNLLRLNPSFDSLAAHRFSQSLQALAEFLGGRGLCARVEEQPKSLKP